MHVLLKSVIHYLLETPSTDLDIPAITGLTLIISIMRPCYLDYIITLQIYIGPLRGKKTVLENRHILKELKKGMLVAIESKDEIPRIGEVMWIQTNPTLDSKVVTYSMSRRNLLTNPSSSVISRKLQKNEKFQ